MSSPILFISHNKIKAGRLEEFRRHYLESVPLTQAGKPGTQVQLAYFLEETGELDIVRLFPDAESLDQQLRGADERSKITYQFITPTGVEIYGTPTPATLEKIQQVAGQGISVRVLPAFLGGFNRPAGGEQRK
jgi:hypothetical protein